MSLERNLQELAGVFSSVADVLKEFREQGIKELDVVEPEKLYFHFGAGKMIISDRSDKDVKKDAVAEGFEASQQDIQAESVRTALKVGLD